MKVLELKQQLQNLKGESELKDYVIDSILNNDDDYVENYIKDVITYGCVNGAVPELIYYSDTHAFYDKFYDDIEILREEYEEQLGEPITIKGDLKNFFAWFAYEQTCYQIANDLNLF